MVDQELVSFNQLLFATPWIEGVKNQPVRAQSFLGNAVETVVILVALSRILEVAVLLRADEI